MPTYQYACTACAHAFDAVQSFSDEALTECPQCQGRLRKLFSSVGVVFKGSGFYRTDSRASGGSSPAPSSTTSDTAGSGSGSPSAGSTSSGSSDGAATTSGSSASSGSSAPAGSSTSTS